MAIRRFSSWFLWILLVVVFMSLIGYWWRYGRSGKANFVLPKKANALINIDLRQLEKTIFWDAIYHPMSYWEESNDDDSDDDKPSKGITFPKQIAFFVLQKHADILFSQPLPVKSDDFQEFADTLVFKNEWELVAKQFVYDDEKQLFYLWDDQKMGVAFAKRAHADFVQTTIADLLAGENCILLPDHLSEKLNQGVHHFTIWQKQSVLTNNEPVFLYGNFEKGSMIIQGEIPFQYSFLEKNNFFKSTDTDVLTISMNLNENNFSFSDSFKRSFQKVTHLELDSFFQYSTGEFNLKVPRIETKIDSIVTYEYDDDFNKIEKISTQEIVAPEVIVHLESKKNGLLAEYFKRRGIVKDIDGKSRFVGLPFVEMEAIVQDKQLILTSGSANEEMQADSNFLKVNISFSQYPQMLKFSPLKLDSSQFALIDGVVIRASQIAQTKKIKLQIKVKMKNQQRNMLGVLVTKP